jgi:subtilisin family serine protease
MDPLIQTKLHWLMSISGGDSNTKIGLIDGPVDFRHPGLKGSNIRTLKGSQRSACENASDLACVHGTFIAGILCAKRGFSAPAICPDCEVILNPLFGQNLNGKEKIPSASPKEMAHAILETVDAGAKIINLSLGMSSNSLQIYDEIQQAYEYTLRKDVIVIVACGNQGDIGSISVINNPWVIPVAACDEINKFHPMSNFGRSIGNRGIMAPGVNIKSAYPGGTYGYLSGTSFAAPFVTGTVALLWSLFNRFSARSIKYALTASRSNNPRRSILPNMLNAENAYFMLKNIAT